jgi:hypothetical protein
MEERHRTKIESPKLNRRPIYLESPVDYVTTKDRFTLAPGIDGTRSRFSCRADRTCRNKKMVATNTVYVT